MLTLLIYRTAVSGILNEQNNKSDIHSDKTNDVVACPLNFGFKSNATIVVKFPNRKNELKNIFQHKICAINTNYSNDTKYACTCRCKYSSCIIVHNGRHCT